MTTKEESSRLREVKSVLYIDDSRMSQQIMPRFLEGLCTVVAASSLEEGWQKLHAESFDLIIADYLYPEGDVLEFLQQLRKEKDTGETPVIVASGSMDRRMVSHAMRMGANDCLQKPYRKQEVCDMVERMLKCPYVKTFQNDVAVVAAVEWEQNGKFFQFGPELNTLVEGNSSAEVAEKMQEAIQRQFATGIKMGYVVNLRLVTHLAELPNPQHPATDS